MKVQLDTRAVDMATAPIDWKDGISLCEALAVVAGVLERLQGALSVWKPWTKVPVTIALAVIHGLQDHKCQGES